MHVAVVVPELVGEGGKGFLWNHTSKVKGVETFCIYKGVDKGVWGLENKQIKKDLEGKMQKFHLFLLFFTGESVLPC